MIDKTIEIRFGPIHAHVKGSSPAILLAHGYHSENSWRVWERNVEALAEPGFTVYALDLLGYGESGSETLGYPAEFNRVAISFLKE